nr:Rne/Rng family ribonuclease [Clostridia bacterium]
MKEIIVSCTKDKNTIVVVEDGNLIEKYEEYNELQGLEGNIYLGKITNILPGMQAAFVDIGNEKNAFLHIKDIIPKKSNQTGNKNEDLNKYNIKDYVKVGMPVIVQVKKDKTDKKGAKVSTNLNIPGKFIVIIPNSEFVTISQKIEDNNEASRLSNIVKDLNIKNYGIIIRTSARNISKQDIVKDIKEVIKIYENIKEQADRVVSNYENNKDFKSILLYDRGNLITKLILDIGYQGLDNIIVNNKDIYNDISIYLEKMNIKANLTLLEKNDILDIYNLKKQIEKISNRKIWLKCGGFITIDKTEALTAIDVNTGKFTGKENIQQTVLKVNSEATIEIAKQIRARDIGGIIIIDYIDMDLKEDEEIIQKLLIENVKKDRTKTQVIGFTKLHLLEMTRKHICSEK